MAAETPVEFGDELRRDRELRNITREQLAGVTRVSVRHITALEAGRWEQLPAKVFSRGFVRSIANHLGLDPDRIVAGFSAVWDDWAQAEEERLHEKARASGEFPRPVTRRRGRPSAAVLGLAVAALLAVATGVTVVLKPGLRARVGAVGQAVPGRPDAAAAAVRPREATPVPLALPPSVAAATVPVPSTGAAPGAGDGSSEAATATQPGQASQPLPSSLAAQPSQASPASPSQQPLPSAAGAPSSPAGPRVPPAPGVQPAAASPAPPAPAGGMKLTLTFLDDCWTEVGVDGQVVAAELCRKGTTREFVGQAKFTLTLENARNVTVSVDGRPVRSLGAAPGSAVVKNFVIDGATARRSSTNG